MGLKVREELEENVAKRTNGRDKRTLLLHYLTQALVGPEAAFAPDFAKDLFRLR
jgi:hypothetical protein